MEIAFRKMHGLGNDFVVIDARRVPFAPSPEEAAAIADRRRGIGCDTLVVMSAPKAGADVALRFFNADGGEAGACGNATRCVAALLAEEMAKPSIALDTLGGRLAAQVPGDGTVTVDMGPPRFGWQDIPLAERMDTRTLELQVGPIDDPILRQPSAVNVGNPHCIFFVADVGAFDLSKIGPMVEFHPLFPEQANVSLAAIEAPDRIRLKVWERGVGITEACGTAACATLAAAARRGMASRKARLLLDGGDLTVEWRQGDDHLLMTGPWAESFSGRFDLADLMAARARR